MRLRQVHAILETATALEACGLGIEMRPFDHDGPGNRDDYGDDHMTGGCEFSDETSRKARPYNIDIRPGPGAATITATVNFDYGPEPTPLLAEEFDVSALDETGERFRGLVGAQVAERIAVVIREHEGISKRT